MTYHCLNGKRGPLWSECQKTWSCCKMTKGGSPGQKKSELQRWKNRNMSLENWAESGALTGWCGTVGGQNVYLQGGKKAASRGRAREATCKQVKPTQEGETTIEEGERTDLWAGNPNLEGGKYMWGEKTDREGGETHRRVRKKPGFWVGKRTGKQKMPTWEGGRYPGNLENQPGRREESSWEGREKRSVNLEPEWEGSELKKRVVRIEKKRARGLTGEGNNRTVPPGDDQKPSKKEKEVPTRWGSKAAAPWAAAWQTHWDAIFFHSA